MEHLNINFEEFEDFIDWAHGEVDSDMNVLYEYYREDYNPGLCPLNDIQIIAGLEGGFNSCCDRSCSECWKKVSDYYIENANNLGGDFWNV